MPDGRLATPTARFDASAAECLVFTDKAGLLSGVAHDLKLRVERFEIVLEHGAVRARFDASSLRVVCARSGGRDDTRALSERDRREIEATIAREVLDARRHPWIEFRSGPAVLLETGEARLQGTLAVRGRERPLTLTARRDGDRAVAETAIHQPDFGIKPYTAMLGALRVKPDVRVRLAVPWPQ